MKKIKAKESDGFISELVKNKTIVEIRFHLQNDRYKAHFFKGVISSAEDDLLVIYDDKTGKKICVENKNIIVLSIPKIHRSLQSDYDVGLRSMGRGQDNKKSSSKTFSYNKWWKNLDVKEVDY